MFKVGAVCNENFFVFSWKSVYILSMLLSRVKLFNFACVVLLLMSVEDVAVML